MRELDLTRSWLQKVVIDLGLCPFAYDVFSKDKIKYEVTDFTDAEQLLGLFSDCISDITDDSSRASTALMVISSGLEDFNDYLAVYESLTGLLPTLPKGEQIQLASFHPKYQFANTNFDDVENFTNRSPYPIIHLLMVDDVSEAIDSHPDVASVPTQNIDRLNDLGIDQIKALLESIGINL